MFRRISKQLPQVIYSFIVSVRGYPMASGKPLPSFTELGSTRFEVSSYLDSVFSLPILQYSRTSNRKEFLAGKLLGVPSLLSAVDRIAFGVLNCNHRCKAVTPGSSGPPRGPLMVMLK